MVGRKNVASKQSRNCVGWLDINPALSCCEAPCTRAKIANTTAVAPRALEIGSCDACAVAVCASTPTITLHACHHLHPLGLEVILFIWRSRFVLPAIALAEGKLGLLQARIRAVLLAL